MIVTIDGMPVYRAIMTDDDTGMLRISLVDAPAVMSDFVAFDAARRPVLYAVQDEEKRLVRGCIMRADFPIYRREDKIGEFYIIYKPDTIRQMAEKYLLDGRQNLVNLMHRKGSEVDGVQLVQYFIKGDGVQVEGFDDCADGSLFGEFHVVNESVWADIKAGVYRGFSLEGVFDLEPEQDAAGVTDIVEGLNGNFEKTNYITNMQKAKKFRAALAKLLRVFGVVDTDKGALSWDGENDLKAGDEVFSEDETGTAVPAPDGDYKTADGKIITVDGGRVVEIKDEAAEVASEEEDDSPSEVSTFGKWCRFMAESYEERTAAIAKAIAKVFNGDWFVIDAGDDFAVIEAFEDDNISYYRFPVTWVGDVPEVGTPVEVKIQFIPIDAPNPFEEAAPAAPAVVEELRRQVASLKAEVSKFQRQPAAKPAHEVVKAGYQTKTGNKGLDNLARILSAK